MINSKYDLKRPQYDLKSAEQVVSQPLLDF